MSTEMTSCPLPVCWWRLRRSLISLGPPFPTSQVVACQIPTPSATPRCGALLPRSRGRRLQKLLEVHRNPRGTCPSAQCLLALGLRRGTSPLLLVVDALLRLLGNLAGVAARLCVKVGQPVVPEPGDGLCPAELVRDDGLEFEILFSRVDSEPPVHGEHLHREGVELEPRAQQEADDVAHVGQGHHEIVGQGELAVHGGEPHAHHRAVELLPEERVPLGHGVRAAVGADVELAQGGAARVERALGDDETVGIVVYVGEADAVLAVAEDAQLARARDLEEVGEEEVVSGAVHLVRGHSAGHEVWGARLAEEELAARLGRGVLLEVALLRQRGHLVFGETVHIAAVKSRGGARAHDNLGAAHGPARLHHVDGAVVVHLIVELGRVVGSHGGAVVPHAVRALARLDHSLLVTQVSHHILDGRVVPSIWGTRRHVKRDHALRAALHEHLHQALPHEAGTACHHAVGGNGRVAAAQRRLALEP
mmetsp:Transcript_6772/g.18297  ORF Transcript_6772/g.18297 Transcript_6772/m.18297 type:complete len:478 (+) Transcript_6772:157-1590(+)